MIFALVQDFADALAAMPEAHPRRRALSLLEEALRRDLDFVDRHPTTLFQCLWNSCWWYDCLEASRHHDKPEGGWGPGGPPWRAPGVKLSPLLSKWLRQKIRGKLTAPWLRSLRPPRRQLGAGPRRRCSGHSRPVECLDFSPDGQLLASGSRDGTVRVWHPETGAAIRSLGPSKSWVRAVRFSEDGGLLAGAYSDGRVILWNTHTGEPFLALNSGVAEVRSVAFHPGGEEIALGGADGRVQTWDLSGGKRTWRSSAKGLRVSSSRANGGPRDRVGDYKSWTHANAHSVAYSDDGKVLTSGFWDGTLRRWRRRVKSWEALAPDGPHSVVGFLGLSRRAKYCMSASVGFALPRVFDASTGKTLWENFMFRSDVVGPSFSEAARLAAVSGDGRTLVVDFKSGSSNCILGQQSTCTALSPDGRMLATGAFSGEVCLWEPWHDYRPRPIRGQGDEVRDQIRSIAFSADGSRVAAEYFCDIPMWYTEERFWDAGTGVFAGTGNKGGPMGHCERSPTAAPRAHPYSAEVRAGELELVEVISGVPLGWLPVGSGRVVTHPGEPLWAVAPTEWSNYFFLLRMENV